MDCPDRSGLIHQITGLLASRRANIVANAEFVDRENNRFFMRTEFSGGTCGGLVQELRMALPSPANVRLESSRSRRLVVLVSREHHCLGELLLRNAHDDLGAEILAVVSNHSILEELTRRFGVSFHFVPHDAPS